MLVLKGTAAHKTKNIATALTLGEQVQAVDVAMIACNKATETVMTVATNVMAAKGDLAASAGAAVALVHDSEEVRSSISRCRR